MKTISIALILFLFAITTNAANNERLKTLVKANNKVYITAEKSAMTKYAKKVIRKCCWTVTDNPKEADFVIKFEGGGWFAHAVIIDPVDKSVLYKTPTSNTMASMTFNAKKKVVKKLINKHIRPLCDPAFLNDLDFKQAF